MTAVQLDLFGEIETQERRRFRDALACLADVHPNALEIIIGVRRSDRGEIEAGKSGSWAYSVRPAGFHFEDVNTWGGWYAKPAGLITWDELDDLVSADPRVEVIRSWSESLTAVDAWRDRARPFEMWPEPDGWHRSYIESDHARPGWAVRRRHWELTLAVLRDARAAL